MKILKFGGTSVGDAERVGKVLQIISQYHERKEDISVVFSAFGGVTDQLIDLSNQAVNRNDSYLASFQNIRLRHLEVFDKLITHPQKNLLQKTITDHFDELADILKGLYLLRELTPRILDSILSYGERLSAFIISEALKSRHIDCEYLNASKIIKTNSVFGNAHVNLETTNKNIIDYFKDHKNIQIITGFIGSDDNNEITTIGRGGSDFTASIIGSALKVSEIEHQFSVGPQYIGNELKMSVLNPKAVGEDMGMNWDEYKKLLIENGINYSEVPMCKNGALAL